MQVINRIELRLLLRDDLGAHEIVPRIDGDSLIVLIDKFEIGAKMHPADGAYGGLIPTFFRFEPPQNHFYGRSAGAPGPMIPLLGCDCGEWGCWPLLARITVTEQEVVWDGFEQPHRRDRDYREFGPFRFERQQYDAAVEGLVLELAATEV